MNEGNEKVDGTGGLQQEVMEEAKKYETVNKCADALALNRNHGCYQQDEENPKICLVRECKKLWLGE